MHHVAAEQNKVACEMQNLTEKHAETSVQCDKRINDLEREVKVLKEEKKRNPAASSVSQARPQQAPGKVPPKTPYRERTVARIGNLGWDTEAAVLVQRAAGMLEKASVPSDSYRNLLAVSGRAGTGSACELSFKSAQDLQRARLSIRNLTHEFSAGKVVWLDAQKEPEELRVLKVMYRIEEMLKEMESSRQPPLEVSKNMRGGYLAVGGNRAAFVFRGEVKWASWAANRYSEEEREWAASYSMY